MQHSESIDKIVPAMFDVQRTIGPAPKQSDNPFFKSKYADLITIWNHVQETLTANGLFIIQTGEPSQLGTLNLTTTIMHKSGQWIGGTITFSLAKNDPQATGSAITYARRYGLSAILGLMTDKDDDGEGAMNRKKQTGTGAVPAVKQDDDFAGF